MLCTEKDVETDIANRIFEETDLDASKIDIGFDAGIVTLKGLVRKNRQRHTVENLAYEFKDVIDVKNELAVVPSNQIDDERVARDIMDEFRDQYDLEFSDLLIEVDDGVVTLTGTAPDLAAKVYAYVAAVRASGVMNVVDNVNVASK